MFSLVPKSNQRTNSKHILDAQVGTNNAENSKAKHINDKL